MPMSENRLELLESRAKRIVGVPCVTTVNEQRVEILARSWSGFVRLEYRKSGREVSRNDLLA